MEIRQVEQKDIAQVDNLWAYCFEKKDDPFFQYYFGEYVLQKNTVIGGFTTSPITGEEKLATMLHLNPYILRLRGREVEVPYIVGVATAPEARGQHLIRPLFEKTFNILREKGIDFVTLMPIFAGIYLPYEFSYCYFRHKYDLPLEKLTLSKLGRDLVVEHVKATAELLAPLYERLTAKYNGVPVRDAFEWKKTLTVQANENVDCAVVYREGQPCAYMLYKIEGEVFTIVELLADAMDAQNRLLHYAAAHQSSAKKLVWYAPQEDKTYLQLADQAVYGAQVPFLMARCVNAQQALANYDAPISLRLANLVLQVTDSVIATNNATLQLNVSEGRVICEPTEAQPEAVLNMSTFTQLYWGTFSATELAEAGQLISANPETLTKLDALFPKCATFNNEYF